MPPEYIKDYLYGRFEDYKETEYEFMVNSPFFDDYKFKLSINKETGLWQDFVSGRKGNFVSFVAAFEGIGYKEAQKMIFGEIRGHILSDMERLCQKGIYSDYARSAKVKPQVSLHKKIVEGYGLKEIDVSSIVTDPLAYKSCMELRSRGIPYEGMMYATSGRFYGRLIIPTQDVGSEFTNFSAKDMTGKFGMKYLNFSEKYALEDLGMDVSGSLDKVTRINPGEKIAVLTESSLDALSCFYSLGPFSFYALNGASMSSDLKEELSKYAKVYVFPDLDAPGIRAAESIAKQLSNVYVLDREGIQRISKTGGKDLGDLLKTLDDPKKRAVIRYFFDKRFEPYSRSWSAMAKLSTLQ